VAREKENITALTHALRLTRSLLKDRFTKKIDPNPVPVDCDELKALRDELQESLDEIDAEYAEHCVFAKPTEPEANG